MQDEAVIAKVQSDLKEATALGLQSTPSFVLNGKRLDTSSVTSFEAFETLIKNNLVK
jgi:protein-disulfide isomerase